MSLSSDSVSLHLMELDIERILSTGPLGQTFDSFCVVVNANLDLFTQVIKNQAILVPSVSSMVCPDIGLTRMNVSASRHHQKFLPLLLIVGLMVVHTPSELKGSSVIIKIINATSL